jgi:hypothetical protein
VRTLTELAEGSLPGTSAGRKRAGSLKWDRPGVGEPALHLCLGSGILALVPWANGVLGFWK